MKVVFLSLAMMMVLTILSGCGMEQIPEGARGIPTRFSKLDGEPLGPGLHFYNPFTSDIEEFDVKEQKLEGTTDAFTKDTQVVKISYAVTLYPDPKAVNELYSQFGKREWGEKIVPQAVLGAIKDVVGQYEASDLVGKREIATKVAQDEIARTLKERHVIVTRLDWTNLDFDDQYEKAVEQKVTAVELAKAEKNKTVQIQEQANQTVATAKADAEAMRIKSQALSQNKNLVGYEIATRWDGKLPQIVLGSGAMPMIDLKSLKNEE